MEAEKDAAMIVPTAEFVSVSSNDDGGGGGGGEGGGEGGGGGRFPVQAYKISKKALMDDTGVVVGSSLKMKSLTRAVSKKMTSEKNKTEEEA